MTFRRIEACPVPSIRDRYASYRYTFYTLGTFVRKTGPRSIDGSGRTDLVARPNIGSCACDTSGICRNMKLVDRSSAQVLISTYAAFIRRRLVCGRPSLDTKRMGRPCDSPSFFFLDGGLPMTIARPWIPICPTASRRVTVRKSGGGENQCAMARKETNKSFEMDELRDP